MKAKNDVSAPDRIGCTIHNGNHLRSVEEGVITGTVRPVHLGRRTHVWNIRIEDEEGRLANVSRLTILPYITVR